MTPRRIQTQSGRAMPAAMWEMLASAPHRLLMLDCDGTLAPIRLYRSRARVPETVLKLLRALGWSRRTSLAIVSGRQLGELEALFPAVPAHLVAEHGWVERSREVEQAATALWKRHHERDGLRLERFGGGVELLAVERHKGTAAERLLSRSPRGAIPVFLGDDVPDERAFGTVNAVGFAIRVGKPDGPTAAQLFLSERREVQWFLREWLARLERPEAAPRSRARTARPTRGTEARAT